MNPKTFFGELKRRNVLKVAAAYAVVAWLLIEAVALWLSIIGAPTGVIKGFIVFLAVAFAMTLYISWAFEATPEGMKRTAKVSRDAVLPTWSPRKFALFIVIVALLAASLHVYGRLRSKSAAPPATTGSETN